MRPTQNQPSNLEFEIGTLYNTLKKIDEKNPLLNAAFVEGEELLWLTQDFHRSYQGETYKHKLFKYRVDLIDELRSATKIT